ncbi:hypothetical protein ACFPRL_17655 [Pseudoclavibacter helvolus]
MRVRRSPWRERRLFSRSAIGSSMTSSRGSCRRARRCRARSTSPSGSA